MTTSTKVNTFIKKHNLIERRDAVLIGVSGGPDSMALLSLLDEMKHDLGIKIVVVNINHQLRKEAVAEQSFVADFCKSRNIPFVPERVTIAAVKNKTSIEELSREKRLHALVETAKKLKADRIALGHHEDDLAETVLMRILRGSGMQGLIGILPCRKINGSIFIRPLLCLTRKEILSYLKEKHIRFRTDSTNKLRKFSRNKIRLELLPFLQKNYQPRITKLLANLADNLATDYDFLAQEARACFQMARTNAKAKKTITLQNSALINLHLSMRRMVYRIAIENLKGNTNQLTSKNFSDIDILLLKMPHKAVIHLPKGLAVTKRKDILLFSCDS